MRWIQRVLEWRSADGGSGRQAKEGQHGSDAPPSSAGATGSDPFLIELEKGGLEPGAQRLRVGVDGAEDVREGPAGARNP